MYTNFLKTNLLLLTSLCYITHLRAVPAANTNATTQTVKKNISNDIPPTEDLMREHGILNRLLLIYEELIRRIDTKAVFPVAALEQSTNIMKSFIEDYHEKLEEDYIFPIFEKNKKELRLVRTLKKQHDKGRAITAELQKLIAHKQCHIPNQKKKIKNLLQQSIRMYRPHEAREDTVLFPQVHSLLSEQEFDKLGDTFEKLEQQLFGKDGFETTVTKIAAIESDLGIYALEQFTPADKNGE